MPVRHFLRRDYLHIFFYLKFLVFVSLVPQISIYFPGTTICIACGMILIFTGKPSVILLHRNLLLLPLQTNSLSEVFWSEYILLPDDLHDPPVI